MTLSDTTFLFVGYHCFLGSGYQWSVYRITNDPSVGYHFKIVGYQLSKKTGPLGLKRFL